MGDNRIYSRSFRSKIGKKPVYETHIDQIVEDPSQLLAKANPLSNPKVDLGFNSRYKVIPNFFAGALDMRKHFDAIFANPYSRTPVGQIWELWYVPETYTLLRTVPQKLMPETLLVSFMDALSALNLGRPSWPTMSMYLSGMKQEIHNDAAAGKFAYVYSLTLDERRSIGGETLIWKPHSMVLGDRPNAGQGFFDAVAPRFGQLLLFDDQCPHSVVMMQGASTPYDARVVLNGHLQ